MDNRAFYRRQRDKHGTFWICKVCGVLDGHAGDCIVPGAEEAPDLQQRAESIVDTVSNWLVAETERQERLRLIMLEARRHHGDLTVIRSNAG